jgi:hypothetical protein
MISLSKKEHPLHKPYAFIFALVVLLSACGPAATQPPTPTLVPTIALPTSTQTSTVTPTVLTPTKTHVPNTPTPSATPTPAYPPEGRGPSGFAAGINPLTGLPVSDPQLLERRPIVIKVENLPREHRPQWGLSFADLVYEYYTEFGATRFAAIFYGNDAEQVGPIRSGRFFDSNVVQMYKAVFIYGSAYPDVQNRFFNSDFYQRLILENVKSCPALCRFDPNGQNLLVANTAALQEYLVTRGVDNTRQDLDGMLFKAQPPAGGVPGSLVFLRYSGAIYNRWDYDPTTERYLRSVDNANDVNRQNEVYVPLTDRLNGQQIAADNLVTLCVPHLYYVKREDAEVLEIIMDNQRLASYYSACDGQNYPGNAGPAYIARDGQMYKVTWQRSGRDAVLTLLNPDGTLFPFKPGQTWFEVIGASSSAEQEPDGAWRFTHRMGP